MRKTVCVLAIILVGTYLIVGRNFLFAELERQAEVGSHSVISPRLNLSKEGQFVWKVPREKWRYEEGDSQLSLLLDRSPGLPENSADRSTMGLRLKVEAYAVPQGGKRTDRLIRNWYYSTDEPFSPGARLWAAYGDKGIEYGLGGVRVYPSEDVYVVMNVTVPSPELQMANPRLKLVGEHDYAIFEHLPFLRAIRDVGLAVSLLLLVTIVSLAWRGPGTRTREPN
jgi:hypothetical protein